MVDINNQDFQESEYNDSGNSPIDYSTYTTMESLAKMLEGHYDKLERFQDVCKELDDHYENFYHLFEHCKKTLKKDEEDFEIGQFFPQEIQEKISDIQTDIDYITSIYIELTSKFERVIENFDDPKDQFLYKAKYEYLLKNIFDVCVDMGDVLVSYQNLEKYNDEL